MKRSAYYHWGIFILYTVIYLIRVRHPIMDNYPVKTASTRKTISTKVNVTDEETLDSSRKKITGESII